jgi:hypothetical protein
VVDVDGLIRLLLSVHQDLRGDLVDDDVGKGCCDDVGFFVAYIRKIRSTTYLSIYRRKRTYTSLQGRYLAARYPRESLVTRKLIRDSVT